VNDSENSRLAAILPRLFQFELNPAKVAEVFYSKLPLR
jgi:hypothetical protein